MLRRPPFCGVVAPVPRGQIAVHAVRVHHLRQHFGICVGLCLGGLPDLHQQIAHGVGRLGHLRLELVIGEAVVAQQRRTFVAQRQRLGSDGAVVRLAAIRAARLPCAESAVSRRSRRGLNCRNGVISDRDSVTTGPPASFSSPAARAASTTKSGKPVQIAFAQLHEPAALIGQQVLGKLRAQHGQAALDLLHPRLVRPCRARRLRAQNRDVSASARAPAPRVRSSVIARLPRRHRPAQRAPCWLKSPRNAPRASARNHAATPRARACCPRLQR